MTEVPPDFEIIKEEASAERERNSTKDHRNGEGMNDGGAEDDERSERGKTKDGRGERREHDAELAA